MVVTVIAGLLLFFKPKAGMLIINVLNVSGVKKA
jgi:hypothetical protein